MNKARGCGMKASHGLFPNKPARTLHHQGDMWQWLYGHKMALLAVFLKQLLFAECSTVQLHRGSALQ